MGLVTLWQRFCHGGHPLAAACWHGNEPRPCGLHSGRQLLQIGSLSAAVPFTECGLERAV